MSQRSFSQLTAATATAVGMQWSHESGYSNIPRPVQMSRAPAAISGHYRHPDEYYPGIERSTPVPGRRKIDVCAADSRASVGWWRDNFPKPDVGPAQVLSALSDCLSLTICNSRVLLYSRNTTCAILKLIPKCDVFPLVEWRHTILWQWRTAELSGTVRNNTQAAVTAPT